MQAKEIREKFLKFFEEKGHKIIPSASLLPENDPTVLFTTAGMHPLVPYLMGEKHPLGQRLTDAQKCIRTGDIEDVGDMWHLSFFEMLGNWSLGDYFKEDAIKMSWEFLTSKKWMGLEPSRIYVSVFAGDKDAPKDEKTIKIWQELFDDAGIPKDNRIFAFGKKDNWWGPAGITGPCGPDTEMFYDTGKEKCGKDCNPSCGCGKFVEIWNDVFMQYNKTVDGKFELLSQQNVDTGMGLERMTAVMQGKDNVYDTELFMPIIVEIEKLSDKKYGVSREEIKAMRIIADHIKAATFVLGDDKAITPSNVQAGYVLRRFIRRAVRYGKQLGINDSFTAKIAQAVVKMYKEIYPELEKNQQFIIDELNKEEEKFAKTLEKGLKILHTKFPEGKKLKLGVKTEPFLFRPNEYVPSKLTGEWLANFYQTYGFPFEMAIEEIRSRKIKFLSEFQVNKLYQEFQAEMKKHQDLSRTASAGMFKGGLADASEETKKLHTTAHLLLQALREVLGENVFQKGSNITAERLRFDFSHPAKMTPEQIKRVENIVNEKIVAKFPVACEEMSVDAAKEQGAMGVFGHKYGDKVKVYSIGNFSKEICGGPHVKNTSELGEFKIIKEESSSSGVRRIKAVLMSY